MIKVKTKEAVPPVVISVNKEELFMYKDNTWFFKAGQWYSIVQIQICKLLNDIKDNSSKYQE